MLKSNKPPTRVPPGELPEKYEGGKSYGCYYSNPGEGRISFYQDAGCVLFRPHLPEK
jgi:hypothetical protein